MENSACQFTDADAQEYEQEEEGGGGGGGGGGNNRLQITVEGVTCKVLPLRVNSLTRINEPLWLLVVDSGLTLDRYATMVLQTQYLIDLAQEVGLEVGQILSSHLESDKMIYSTYVSFSETASSSRVVLLREIAQAYKKNDTASANAIGIALTAIYTCMQKLAQEHQYFFPGWLVGNIGFRLPDREQLLLEDQDHPLPSSASKLVPVMTQPFAIHGTNGVVDRATYFASQDVGLRTPVILWTCGTSGTSSTNPPIASNTILERSLETFLKSIAEVHAETPFTEDFIDAVRQWLRTSFRENGATFADQLFPVTA